MQTPRRWFTGHDFALHTVDGPHDPDLRGHTHGEFTEPMPKFLDGYKCEACLAAPTS